MTEVKSSSHIGIMDHIRRFATAAMIAQVITLFAAILTRRFLGPIQTGVWAVLQIILSYAAYSTLGATEAITRKVPLHRGKEEYEIAEDIKDNVILFTMVTAILTSMGIWVYACIFSDNLKIEVFYGLILLGVVIILTRLNNLFVALIRAYKDFGLASKQMLWSAIFNAIAIAILTYYFKIYGFMFAMCISLIFNVVYISIHRKIRIKWNVNIQKTYFFIRFGCPLMALGFLNTVFLSIDRIMIAAWLGIEALGLYSIAMLAYRSISHLPNSVGTVLVPHFHEKYAVSENVQDLKDYVVNTTRAFGVITPLIIGLVWIVSPYVLRAALPEFIDSISSVRWLILGVYFLALLQPYSNLAIVVDKRVSLLVIAVLTCVVALILDWLALRAGLGIGGVALGTTLAMIFKFMLVYSVTSKLFLKRRESWSLLLSILAKFGFLVVALLSPEYFMPVDLVPVLDIGLRLGILFLVFFPFLYRMNAQFALIQGWRKSTKGLKVL